MKEKKLIRLYKTTNKKERALFKRWVKFQRTGKTVDLLILLEGEYPTFDCTSEKLFVNLYPEQEFEEQRLSKLLHDLTRLLEDFWCYQQLQKDKNQKTELLLKALTEKSLKDDFEKIMNKAEKEQLKENIKNRAYWKHDFFLKQMKSSMRIAHKSRVLDGSLLDVMNTLDYYYISEKLYYYLGLLNSKSLNNKMQEDELISTFELLKKMLFIIQEIPSLEIYYQLILLLKKEGDEQQYHKVKILVESNPNALKKEEKRQVYMAIANYCGSQADSGKSIYLRERFKWYNKMLKEEVLLKNNFLIPPENYRTIVRVALLLKKIDWVKNFIQENAQKLQPESKEGISNFCNALLAFHEQEYEKVEDIRFDPDDVYHYAEHRVLLIKTYFELSKEEKLRNLFNSFRTYLSRDKIIPYQDAYLNFISFTKRLADKQGVYKPDFVKLKDDISNAKHITEKEWLLSKTPTQTKDKTKHKL